MLRSYAISGRTGVSVVRKEIQCRVRKMSRSQSLRYVNYGDIRISRHLSDPIKLIAVPAIVKSEMGRINDQKEGDGMLRQFIG